MTDFISKYVDAHTNAHLQTHVPTNIYTHLRNNDGQSHEASGLAMSPPLAICRRQDDKSAVHHQALIFARPMNT